ncbi:MAG: glycoside hydrolase family 13 protein [Actinomycetaceae bacterium]|nr:glycoside hydrolase family 13 protein [Actinomycetaceae bacterium]
MASSVSLNHPWWHSAVIYQIYPRSFASTDGPIGTIRGITSKLEYLHELGVDAIWISPFYPSPQNDAGYDVANYHDIDPRFGTLCDADEMIARAHDLGLKVIIDLVPNHTSDEHEWFQAALEAGPGSPERNRYWFRDGDEIPNDWRSVFGGPAWTRVSDRADAVGSSWENDRQWYLNLFDSSQPDLNWENPEVRDYFDSILRFWLDRGVDGFRVDVAHGLVKDPQLPNFSGDVSMVHGGTQRPPMFDQEGVHEIFRRWNAVLGEYEGDRILVAEAWVDPPSRLTRYVREDEMHQAFNFTFLATPWNAGALRSTIDESLRVFGDVGRPATWVLSNHDVVRHASRLGLSVTGKGPNGIFASDEQPDAELGLQRAKAATQLMLALPGSAYLYQGEELGLPEHTTLPNEVREDPAFFRTAGAEAGRDGCRVPLPWSSEAPAYGFSPSGETWLPQPPKWRELAVDRQEDDPASTLQFYRRLIALRTEWNLGEGSFRFIEAPEHVVAGISSTDRGEFLIVTSVDGQWILPNGWTIAAQSSDTISRDGRTVIGSDTTVWATRSDWLRSDA